MADEPICGVTIYLDPICGPDDKVTIEAYSESVLETVDEWIQEGHDLETLMFVGPNRTEIIPTHMIQRVRVHHQVPEGGRSSSPED